MPMVRVDRRLWLTADRTRLVEDGDPEAAFLWAAPGDEVDQRELERLTAAPAERAEKARKWLAKVCKAKRKPADKALKDPPETKGA